jgi:DNA-directed RNA polymerase II subunit RPB3
MANRPLSKNAVQEPKPDDFDRFDYNAVPDKFYFNVETVGGMDAESCFQQGIRVLQQKIAGVMEVLSPSEQTQPTNSGGADYDEYVPRSPDAGAGMGPGGYTSYGGGAASAWGGGGATTPYGGGTTQYGSTTPYGQPGWQ